MSSASDGDGRGACGAQGLPVGPPPSGSVRSSGSRVGTWEPHGSWDSSLLSSFLLLDPTCLPGGAVGMLRGRDPLGDGGLGRGGAEKGASPSPACGPRKETGDEDGWGAEGGDTRVLLGSVLGSEVGDHVFVPLQCPLSLTCLPGRPPEPLVPQAAVSVWGRAVSASGQCLQELGRGGSPTPVWPSSPLKA